ncbi:hypothetical protein OF83DRAFT_1179092 [Amylostereum chailletii]|nr:hypothetical protein OF83DRAFT_1179092 [Amylostereum chailletii]
MTCTILTIILKGFSKTPYSGLSIRNGRIEHSWAGPPIEPLSTSRPAGAIRLRGGSRRSASNAVDPTYDADDTKGLYFPDSDTEEPAEVQMMAGLTFGDSDTDTPADDVLKITGKPSPCFSKCQTLPGIAIAWLLTVRILWPLEQALMWLRLPVIEPSDLEVTAGLSFGDSDTEEPTPADLAVTAGLSFGDSDTEGPIPADLGVTGKRSSHVRVLRLG